ncbi:MAG: hypothetical protein HFE77_00290 [Clostridiales bacterium]|nr:hypothetical protein [Clostridiales bacterium]
MNKGCRADRHASKCLLNRLLCEGGRRFHFYKDEATAAFLDKENSV